MHPALHLRRPSRRVARIAGALVLAAIVIGAMGGRLTNSAPNPGARLEKARDLAYDHKPEAALKQVRRALAELGPEDDSALKLQALTRAAQITDMQLGSSRANEALGWYREIVKQFPRSPEAYDSGVRIAELLHLRFADDLHAEQQLLSVVAAFPKQAGVERLLIRAARLAMESRRYDEARSDVERLLKEYASSELSGEARSLVGEVLHLQGHHSEAAQAYELVATTVPGTELAARALEEEGNCLAEMGDFSHAMGKYIEALPDHPSPLSVQRSLERVRRRFSALRAVEPGSKAYAFGNRFEHHD